MDTYQQLLFPKQASQHVQESPYPKSNGQHWCNTDLEALSTADLMSLAMGEPFNISLSHKLLSEYTCYQHIVDAPLNLLANIDGMTLQKARRFKAIGELQRRMAQEQARTRFQIDSPQQAIALFEPLLQGKIQEEMWVVCLDTRLQVLTKHMVYRGTVSGINIRVSEILRFPIRQNAPFIMLGHNHPSGNPTPSRRDITTTNSINEAANLMGIELKDHIIVGNPHSVSLKQKRLF